MDNSFLMTNIGELITLDPLVQARRLSKITPEDLGRLQNAWLLVENGQIKDYGSSQPPKTPNLRSLDANRALILPGLVDAHTHTIFGGSRAKEFAMRLEGATYQEIAAAGGGIKSTIRHTRDTPSEELLTLTLKRLRKFAALGVTTVEIKSGYGQSVDEELRILKVIKQARQQTPQTLVSTCLALHALPPEFETVEEYVDVVINRLLDQVAKNDLARYCDVFVETGYFGVSQCEAYVERVKDLGLGIRIHADEFADAGAAAAAARWGAASADHLECASDAGIAAMAKAGVVAILLPGTSLYTKIPFANAQRFRDHNCPIALATDFNPGSCRVDNLSFTATLGAIHCGLTASEALAAVTYVPAASLGLADRKGALARGFDADFSLFPYASMEEWLADLGQTPPDKVYIGGQRL